MSREPIRITREELHRLVWSKTLRRVAEELGTSYVELVKACTAMDAFMTDVIYGTEKAVRKRQTVATFVFANEQQDGGASLTMIYISLPCGGFRGSGALGLPMKQAVIDCVILIHRCR